MRIESSIKIFKLTVNFRVVSKGFDITNYIKSQEYSEFEKYKRNNKIVTNNEYPLLLMEFNGSDPNIRGIILEIKTQINSTDELVIKYNRKKLSNNLILLSLNGIQKLSVNIQRISFNFRKTKYKEVSTNAPIEYDVKRYNKFEKETYQKETYFALTNYLHGSFYYRGLLLKLAFNNLHEIETNRFLKYNEEKQEFSHEGLDLVKSLIQIEIVSKISMYIEDLIILLESNKLNNNYYEMLDISSRNDIDLGDRIGKFFESIDTFTQCDWRNILCYMQDTENVYDVANEIMEKNIEHAKELMKYIESFYKSHRRIFRRYKHAGFPIRYAGQADLSRFFPLKFDFSTGVYIGKDLLRDIVYLPYSDDIIQSYKTLLPSLQVFIKDAIINRLGCIQRGVRGIIPNQFLGSPYEAKQYENRYSKMLRKFELDYPKKFFNVHFESVLNDSYLREMSWYTNLEENKKKWRQIRDIEQKFKDELEPEKN